MKYTIIKVPDMNDSISRIVLSGKVYHIRFTYNDTADYWKLGLYDDLKRPIIVGIKIVPRFPLNAFYGITEIPAGVFGVTSNLERIGRNDFKNGKSQFIFIPVET